MDISEEVSPTLRADMGGHPPLVAPKISCLNGWDTRQSRVFESLGVAPTLAGADGGGGRNPAGLLFENHGLDARYTASPKVAPTISARMGTGGNNVSLVGGPDFQETLCIAGNAIDRQPQNGGNGLGCQADISYTITTSDHHAVFSRQRSDEFAQNDVVATQSARQHKDATDLICQIEIFGQSQYGSYAEGCATLRAQGGDNGGGSENLVKENGRNLIRRLTPLECERLQGFPDGWTDIPGASDSARYKALGNSVAIPCVDFVLRGIAYFLRKLYAEQEETLICTSIPSI